MRLNQWVFLIVFWGLFSSFSHAVKNRLSDEEEAEVRAGVRAGNFEELFEKVLSGKADELAKRKCYFAFEQVLWKGVRGEASIPFDRDRLEDVPKEIRKAPQVKVGPERPFNTLEKPLQTLRLMYDCYAAATLPVEKIEKHPSADGYPGKVVKNARSKKETLNINIGTFEDIISTGLYAPAGKPIRITVPRGVLTKEGSLIQIGDLKQRTKVHKFTQLHRAPYIVRRYDIDSTRITIVSAFGGLIYIRPKLPDNIQVKENEYVCSDGTLLTDEPPPVKKKMVKVTIEGAVRAPYYRYGVNSSGRKRVETSKYPAPIGEFGSDRFIYTMPAKDIKGIDDLDEVIEICNDMYDALGDLTGRPNPPPHTYRACVELNLNGGALYAGQPLTMSRAWVENLDKEVIGWGLAHETGHMHQKKAWTYQNGVEITVNIIAYYAIEKCIEKWGDRVPADMRMNDKWRDSSTKNGYRAPKISVAGLKPAGVSANCWPSTSTFGRSLAGSPIIRN